MKTPGEELFESVERTQGFAFISDAIFDWSKVRVLNVAKNSLANTEATARILRKFIEKHESQKAQKEIQNARLLGKVAETPRPEDSMPLKS